MDAIVSRRTSFIGNGEGAIVEQRTLGSARPVALDQALPKAPCSALTTIAPRA